MRTITVNNNVTLDGVMQAPGSEQEDVRDGFRYGGWARPYNDEVKGRVMAEGMSRPGEMLFGRRTYEQLRSVFQGRTDNPFSPLLDNTMKHVVSNTLTEPLPWQNSARHSGDAAESIAALKRTPGKNLVILGSGLLVQSLLRHDLIDEMILTIHPLVLGAGRRMFADDGTFAKFTLAESVPTTTGAIIATYRLTH